jgi:UDP-3-O-[3-hydroxymyristoyl] glucosamine N-acyltransferase
MKINPIKSGVLARRLGCRLEGNPDLILTGVATIKDATPTELTFLANPRYRKDLPASEAGAILILAEEPSPPHITRLVSTKPYVDFRQALELIYTLDISPVALGIHPQALIDETASVDRDVRIGPFAEVAAGARVGAGSTISNGAYIGRDVKIGRECNIGFNVVIRPDCEIGDRVVIGDGTVVGFDGFGYAPEEIGYSKIPQVGKVVIEDDVEIGANCCIDRATLGETRICRGCKLDNLIQIAHNVKIGEHTVIAAQTGISGSTKIGSRVMMGGQVGIVGHIEIGDRMMIGAQAGVAKSYDIGGLISGYLARPHREALMRDANVNKIPTLFERIKKLEEQLRILKESMSDNTSNPLE